MLGKLIAKKAGRPKRRRGPKPKPKKVVAKKAPVRKNNKKPLSKRAKSEIEKLSGVKLTALKNKTPSEQREYLKTISDRAEREDPLPRRRATGPEGSKPVEQGPLLSKVQLPEKMSKAQARKLIMQGKAKVRTDKNGKKKLVSTGEYAPARGVVAEEMGLIKRGKLPSEAELKEMGGFEMRNKGGKVKRKAGGNLDLKAVERGKMRKTIQNIKGTPSEIAKDRRRKKIKKPTSLPDYGDERKKIKKSTSLPDYGDELYETRDKNSETEAQIARMIKGAFSSSDGLPDKPLKKRKRKELPDSKKYKTMREQLGKSSVAIDYDQYYEGMKHGGTIKRRMGGKVRGYGKAQRGY